MSDPVLPKQCQTYLGHPYYLTVLDIQKTQNYQKIGHPALKSHSLSLSCKEYLIKSITCDGVTVDGVKANICYEISESENLVPIDAKCLNLIMNNNNNNNFL